MNLSGTRGLLASAAAAALLLAAPAGAETINLSGSLAAFPALSGNLHGDLAGNVLTLNAIAPKSDLTIDASSPSGVTGQIFWSEVVFKGFGFEIVMQGRTTPVMAVQPWRFGLGGTMDFGAGTADLTAGLEDAVIANVNASSILTFSGSVDSNVTGLDRVIAQGLLSTALGALSSGAQAFHQSSAEWTHIQPGPASAALTRDGSGTTVDLVLTSALLRGVMESRNITVNAPDVPDFLGATFIDDVGERILDVSHLILSEMIMDLLDVFGRAHDAIGLRCADDVSGRRTDITCRLSVALSFTGDAPAAAVPEPATLGMFGAGLAALVLMRRPCARRRSGRRRRSGTSRRRG